ncbi:MAG: MFS transporter [Clostridia bacterium]|nr:MFS transporter [Clostridia bacterium]
MASVLLAVIYAAFISLGLPDSILGSAWPSMYTSLTVPVSFAGVLTMMIAGGTIVSSLLSDKAIRRFGTGVVTTVSVALTALALFGFSFSSQAWMHCLWTIPYGLGAGSVDAALNNFVALHYQSRHMNWLHCFWGIGATVGPSIMGLCLTHNLPWNAGYQIVGVIQVLLVVGLVASLPLWRRQQETVKVAVGEKQSLLAGLKLPGAVVTLSGFFCYCAVEITTGLWAGSYMVLHRGIASQTAASVMALFYLGITVGRFGSGFLTLRLSDRQMVRLGESVAAAGLLMILLPLTNAWLYAGLALLGLGCAPIYPSLLHETPVNFGQEKSQMLMGLQMASAYTGSTLMPLVFGGLSHWVGMAFLPIYLLGFLGLMVIMTERANCVFASGALAAGAAEEPVNEAE